MLFSVANKIYLKAKKKKKEASILFTKPFTKSECGYVPLVLRLGV